MAKRLILVGGFLGAGKTTLLWETAKIMMAQNKRVGLITNDQAPELVDSSYLARTGLHVSEVSGSCFCCNFDGLLNAMKTASEEANADYLIAEPVGSCTDLSATVINPLKELASDLTLSPFTVLADPVTLNDILNGGDGGLHPSSAYIYRKQLEEADIIAISKKDMLNEAILEELIAGVKQQFPHAEVISFSAKTGEGIDEWIEIVTLRNDSGNRIVEVDYDTYAEGEAVLGWLNTTVKFSGELINWKRFAENLMERLKKRFDELDAAIGHVKYIVNADNQFVMGNMAGKNGITVEGNSLLADQAELTLNARVEMSPEELETIVREELHWISEGMEMNVSALKSLSPGRPQPTHRYSSVI